MKINTKLIQTLMQDIEIRLLSDNKLTSDALIKAKIRWFEHIIGYDYRLVCETDLSLLTEIDIMTINKLLEMAISHKHFKNKTFH
jgi:hypothetical protein